MYVQLNTNEVPSLPAQRKAGRMPPGQVGPHLLLDALTWTASNILTSYASVREPSASTLVLVREPNTARSVKENHAFISFLYFIRKTYTNNKIFV